MKYGTACVVTKEFAKLKLKMYFFLVDDSSEHNKSKECETKRSFQQYVIQKCFVE